MRSLKKRGPHVLDDLMTSYFPYSSSGTTILLREPADVWCRCLLGWVIKFDCVRGDRRTYYFCFRVIVFTIGLCHDLKYCKLDVGLCVV